MKKKPNSNGRYVSALRRLTDACNRRDAAVASSAVQMIPDAVHEYSNAMAEAHRVLEGEPK